MYKGYNSGDDMPPVNPDSKYLCSYSSSQKNAIEPIVKSSKASFRFTGIDLFPSDMARLADGLVPFCQDAGWEPEFE